MRSSLMYSFPVTSTAPSADLCLLSCYLGYKKGCHTWGGWLAVKVLLLPDVRMRPWLHTCSEWLSKPCWQPDEDPPTLESFKGSMAWNWFEYEMQINNRPDSGITGSRYKVGPITWGGADARLSSLLLHLHHVLTPPAFYGAVVQCCRPCVPTLLSAPLPHHIYK